MTAKADSERFQSGANQYAVYLETPDGRLRSPAQTRPGRNIAYLSKHLDEMKRTTATSKLTNWTETASGAITVAALLGCIGILVHSFLDFNLHIPANAVLFYVLCAIRRRAPTGIAASPHGSPAQFDRGTQLGNRGIVIDIGVTADWGG